VYKSIVISGSIASGTTTAAKTLAEKLGLPYRSAGDVFREYALTHNIPLYAKEKIPDELEVKADKELTGLAKKGAVIDSHYAGYFNRNNKEVLKVLLTADEEIRIKRALERTHTHTETEEEFKKREEGLDKKFRKLYANENHLDPKFFDLIIDTTHTEPEEVSKKIIKKFKEEN